MVPGAVQCSPEKVRQEKGDVRGSFSPGREAIDVRDDEGSFLSHDMTTSLDVSYNGRAIATATSW